MSSINIVVCAEKTEYKVAVKNKIVNDELSIIGYADFQPEAKMRIQGFVPDVVVFVLDSDEITPEFLTFVEDINLGSFGCSAIIMTDNVTVDLVNNAAQSGIRRVMNVNIGNEEFLNTVKSIVGNEKKLNQNFNVTKKVRSRVYAFFSGKGGVGKSLVTAMMAVKMNSKGKHTAILDADITGPSIPKAFGLNNNMVMMTKDNLMIPATSALGIDIMSANLLLDNDTDPVIWRGPVIAGAVKQFWNETLWEDVDYMFVDMPPGTGDVPLTVFQSLPVNGIIIVTSPQELVSMIVAKAVKMAQKMNIPIIGLVENMSYLECPDCGKKISVFGESHIDEIAREYNIPVLAKLPIDPKVAEHVDNGTIEYLERDWFDLAAEKAMEL